MTQTLSVTLPSDIIYVSGTVNGVAYTWTLVDTAWQAVVERAADEVYAVALTAVNSVGTSATFQLTLYYGALNLITDRTAEDVARVKYLAGRLSTGTATEAEKAEWSGSLKGAYNASDLNRVGAAVEYVSERLTSQGYSVTVHPKQDWKMEDIPTVNDLSLYRENIAVLRAVISVLPTTPDTPDSLTPMDYVKANALEQILKDVDRLLTNASQCWYFSGELFSGE